MNVRPLCVLALASACAGSGASSGIGHIDPRFVSETADRQNVARAEVYTNANGGVDKLELYHHDAHVVPEAVIHLVNEKYPGAKMETYESELIPDGAWIYEVELTATDGHRCEVSSSADGHLRYVECQVGAAELSPAIAKSVADHAPGGAIQEVERRQAEGVDEMRVESKTGDIIHYLIFDTSTGELKTHTLKVPAVLSVPAR